MKGGSGSGKKDDWKWMYILVAIAIVLASVGYAGVVFSTDDNGNCRADVLDRFLPDAKCPPSNTTTTTPKSTPPPVNVSAGSVVANKSAGGSSSTILPPPGKVLIAVTGLDMTTLYTPSQPVYNQMYIDKPGLDITETVRLSVVGGTVYDVHIAFDLLESTLDQGLLRHLPDGEIREQEIVVRDKLAPGDYSIQLKGRVPILGAPSHNWHLGKVTINAAGMSSTQSFKNWRADDPSRPKWMAVAYPDTWTDFPQGSFYTSIKPTFEKESLDLHFNWDANLIGFRKEITSVVVQQMTYSGKYAIIYVGDVPACVSGTYGISPLPNPLGLPCFFVGGGETILNIPYSKMVTLGPNEGYLKVDALFAGNSSAVTPPGDIVFSTAGSSVPSLVDLNSASDDTSARINFGQGIVGSQKWHSGAEYFSALGAGGFLGLFQAGDIGSGGHPEAQWFK